MSARKGPPLNREFHEAMRLRHCSHILKDTLAAIQQSGRDYNTVAEKGGPTVRTLNRWDHGDVRKPKLESIVGALHAVGGRLEVVTRGERVTATVVPIRGRA